MKIKFLIISIVTFYWMYSQNTAAYSLKLTRTFDLINLFYVDTVNNEKLVEAAIIKMLETLDPHSTYISKNDVKEINEPLEGNFEGIGIQFNIVNDTILVVNTIPGGPSEKLGIRPGDRIIKIDTQVVAGVGIKSSEVVKKLKGPKGTKVNVTIYRKGEKELLDFTIIRDKIPIYSLDAAYMIDKTTGYIKLNRFSATTNEEFTKAIKSLKEKGMKDLILDLSSNGGGYLNAAVEIADHFLSDKKIIVYTQGLNSPRTDYFSTSKGEFEEGRLIIIVDEYSASASEIVSGAVQDWDRGIILGRRTFGKGLVQRPFNLNDGSMIRLTVAKYFTPTGRLIQKPYDSGPEKYNKEIINRYNKGELTNEDKIHFPDSLKYLTLVNKRVVYGGGGIMPDIFVPLDTNAYTKYYKTLMQKGIIYQFLIRLEDTERNNIKKKYPTFESFNNNYIVEQNVIDSLVNFAKKEKVVPKDDEELKNSIDDIKIMIKALIARDLYENSKYFEIINPTRPEYIKAIEVMRDKNLYYKKLKKP
ncbi:MAG: S41 family peptidase [Bacteroidales bacterium]|nr:S41 family peptidase [Bacteroidales bacterium]